MQSCARDFSRATRRAARGEIGRAAADHAADLADPRAPPCCCRAGPRCVPPDRRGPPGDRPPIGEYEPDVDLGIGLQEVHRDRQHVQAPEHDRRRDRPARPAARCIRRSRRARPRRCPRGCAGTPPRRSARVGQREPPARPLEQAGPEMRLELRHLSADGRERHPEPARGRRKAAGVDDRQHTAIASRRSTILPKFPRTGSRSCRILAIIGSL